jgi:molybdopterin molybdotransferase
MLVAGRSGHGADDVSLRVLGEHCELAIHGVALRPGGSASLGSLRKTPVLLLPGDPLECWSAYEMLAGRMIRRMAGRSPELPYAKQQALVGHKIVSALSVVDLCRVRLVEPGNVEPSNEERKVEPVSPAESGGIASVARADGFVIVPAPLEGFAPGTRVEVFVFGPSAPVAGEQSGPTMEQL